MGSMIPQGALLRATAPVDRSSAWIDSTTLVAGVYDVKAYINSGWRQIGWYSVDNVFTTKPPLNIVIAGQSNAIGIGTGGDTTAVPGIITWSSGAEYTTGLHEGVAWQTATIGEGPFFQNNNNIGFQLAKIAVANGDADIVRLMVVGQGGVEMAAWITDGSQYLFDLLTDELTASALPVINWFVWHHGESSGVTAADFGGYYVDLGILKTQLQALDQWEEGVTRFCAGGLGNATDSTDTYSSATPEGSIRMLARDGYPWWTSVVSWDAAVEDDIHFTAAGMKTMAERHYGALKSLPKSSNDRKFQYNRSSYTDEPAYVDTIFGASGNVMELNGIQYIFTNGGAFTVTVNGSGQVILGDATASRTGGAKQLNITGAVSIVNGTRNVIVGDGFSPTGSSEDNTFLGSMTTNRTTADVTASVYLGSRAGDAPLRNNSVFVGAGAGMDHVGTGFGDYHTFVGRYAGHESNSIHSAYIGGFAGQSAVGSQHVAVGMYAGAATGSSFDNCVAIGYQAKWTKSNQVVIGNSSILETFFSGGCLKLVEMTEPAAPSANTGVLYLKDNGSGKTQFCVRFPTGAVQVIATEP